MSSFISNSIPVLYAMLSYFLYASQANVLEQKLSGFSTGAVMAVLYVMMLPLAFIRLGIMKFTGEAIVWPSAGEGMKWMLIAAVVFFAADYFMVAAYTKAFTMGAEYMAAIVGVGILFPVFANIIKRVWLGGAPLNAYHIGSYAVGAVAVVLVLLAMQKEAQDADAAAKQPAAVKAAQ